MEIVINQAGIEEINACRDRSMCGKNVAHSRGFQRLVKAEALLFHQQADVLNGQESGMSFVHVMDGRLDAQFLQSAQSAYSQHDFLPDALMNIAPVELIGNLAVLGRLVLRNVCI
jgi:hypothetical protein